MIIVLQSFLVVTDSHDSAFNSVEAHAPLLSPLKDFVEVRLECF